MSGDTIAEFQRRRRRATRLATPWMLLATVGLILTSYFDKDADWYEMAMIVFVACGIIGAFIAVSIYRCPSCETVPYDEDGVPLNPARCKKCGASLR